MRLAVLLALAGCSPGAGPKGETAETGVPASQGAGGWDSAPDIHDPEQTPAPAQWGCTDGQAQAGNSLDEPLDHSEGHRFRVVQVQTEAFEEFYVTVLFPPADYRSLYGAGAPVVLTSMQSIGVGKTWASEPRAYFPIEFGVVEVQPVHPGWVSAGFATPGLHDGAGPQTAQSLMVAADFALGRTTTSDGSSLRDLVNREVCVGQIAILGASSGGITAATAMRDHAEDLAGHLVGINFYETPSLPMFVVGDTGFKSLDRDMTEDTDNNGTTWDEGRNPAFEGCSLSELRCTMDLSDLAWTNTVAPSAVAPNDFGEGASGVLYLDRNQNGRLDLGPGNHPDADGDGLIGPDEDYFLLPYQDLRTSTAEHQMHSPQVAAAAAEVFERDGPPTHVASASEATEFWAARNALNAASAAVETLGPTTRFALTFAQEDHSVPVAERPHVAVLYTALHQAGASVRTNMDIAAGRCLLGAEAVEDWSGGGAVGADWERDHLIETAIPSEVPVTTARAAATLGLFWDTWGHFQMCPELLSSQ